MATPFTTYAFPLTSVSTNATTSRTDPTRWTDVLNVKDFGATGDGVTDDTVAIQNCFNAAFGPKATPNGGNAPGVYSNKPVFFPPGHYIVTSSIDGRAFSSATTSTDGNNYARLAISTTGLATGDNINVVITSGSTVNGHHWFIRVDDATHCTLMNSSFNGTMTGTVSTPALLLTQVSGIHIFGGGRACTNIECNSAAAVICTNGMSFSQIDNLSFTAHANGISFQLDCDDGNSSRSVNLQSNTFLNCALGGINHSFCCSIGRGLVMGEVTEFYNCYLDAAQVAGAITWNQNAVNNNFYGGNVAGCAIGIYGRLGTFNTIHGVSFQNRTTSSQIDMSFETNASDPFSISGCRSESANFITTGQESFFSISGCNQKTTTSGFFISGSGYYTLNSCYSQNGYIGGNPRLVINDCKFDRTDYLTAVSNNYRAMAITPQPIMTSSASTYRLSGADGSARIQFTSTSPVTVTVPPNSPNNWQLDKGNWVELQQYSTAQVTLAGSAVGSVTLNTPSSRSTRAQYSIIRLTVDADATNTFTLSGDLSS